MSVESHGRRIVLLGWSQQRREESMISKTEFGQSGMRLETDTLTLVLLQDLI